MTNPTISSTPTYLDTNGEFSVLSSQWGTPRDVPAGGLFVEPGMACMLRHRFSCLVDHILVEFAPESKNLRVYALRAGDRVIWYQGLRESCHQRWIQARPPIQDGYLVIEVAHDQSAPVPLHVILWGRTHQVSEIHGVAVGYPPTDAGVKMFMKTGSIILLPRRA